MINSPKKNISSRCEMQCITLKSKDSDEITFRFADLSKKLKGLSDSRDQRGKVYELNDLLIMILLARLSGADTPNAIFEWIRNRQSKIVKRLKLKQDRTPCLNTLRHILTKVVSLAELESSFRHFLVEHYGKASSVLICIDGKTMRGTIPKGETQGVHLLSAYLAKDGIVLKQMLVDTKVNEITIGPELLKGLHIKNKVICADAMQTQRKFCVEVLARGGDYLLFAKENQETLLGDIEQFFRPPRTAPGWYIPQLPHSRAKMISKGHGRIEKRTITVMSDEDQFIDWPGLRQVFQLERQRSEVTTGKESTEIVYGITSCQPEKTTADQLLEWTRQYWHAENSLHYRRDVTLNEDATRISAANLAQSISILNNFLVGLTQKLGFNNLASARRFFDAEIASQLAS